MSKEFKRIVFSNLKAEASGRVRAGFAAIHGNVDAWDDRSHFGCFAKTLSENNKRVKHLWNHDSRTPPIATIVEIKEVGPGEIPDEIKSQFPDGTITGGLKVWREYYDNELANWVLEAVDKGDVNEMSYAFDVVKADYTDEELPTGGTRRVRELRELKLFDTSDVNWGMNPATLANVKGYALEIMPLGTLFQQMNLHLEELKAGRRNSESDMALINQMHKIAVDLGAACDVSPDEETAKSNSNEPEKKEAEAAEESTSLISSEWFEQAKRKEQFLGF
jgi:phage head maturation protease